MSPGATERRTLMEQGPRIPDDDRQQMNCFLCHLQDPNVAEWQEPSNQANRNGRYPPACRPGTARARRCRLRWNADQLDDDELAVISMAYPSPSHCGNCHGLVHASDQPLTLALGSGEHWNTELTGQVFSAQRMRLSALNLKDKDSLGRPWDVHAQRMVECRDCHYAKERPAHLMDSADEASLQSRSTEDLRRCDSCHTDGSGHDWLPEQQKHFTALACEACHVPRVHLPARKQVDASVMTENGTPLISYRGLAQGEPDNLGQAFIEGYRPLLVRQDNTNDKHRWMPMNIVSRWYWVDEANGKEVSDAPLTRAWLSAGHYRAEIVAQFDRNADGSLDSRELRLDQLDKVELIASLLKQQGIKYPAIRAAVSGHHLHHNIALKEAERRCERCHDDASSQHFTLADYVPGGVLPSAALGIPQSLADKPLVTRSGALTLLRPKRISSKTLDDRGAH